MKTLSEKDIKRLQKEGKVEKLAPVAVKKPGKADKGNGEDKQFKLIEKALQIAQMQGDKTIELSTLSHTLVDRLLAQIKEIKEPIDVKIDVRPPVQVNGPKPIRNWKFTVARDRFNYITEINAEAVD